MLITSIRFRSRRLHGRRGLKYICVNVRFIVAESPPSRAAWIEMYNLHDVAWFKMVAAFTGGVD